MLKGRGVWSFTVMFLEMWNAFRTDTGKFEDFRPCEEELENMIEAEAGSFVQPFSDSPLDSEPVGENVYIEILSQARKYVYIFTPYLIIDNELQSALCLAAKRGVDVRIVTPGIPGKKKKTLQEKSQLQGYLVLNIAYQVGFGHRLVLSFLLR